MFYLCKSQSRPNGILVNDDLSLCQRCSIASLLLLSHYFRWVPFFCSIRISVQNFTARTIVICVIFPFYPHNLCFLSSSLQFISYTVSFIIILLTVTFHLWSLFSFIVCNFVKRRNKIIYFLMDWFQNIWNDQWDTEKHWITWQVNRFSHFLFFFGSNLYLKAFKLLFKKISPFHIKKKSYSNIQND